VINTAYIEGLNATFRAHPARWRAMAGGAACHTLTLHEGMFLVSTVYNSNRHRPLLDDPRTAVVSCAAVSLGTAATARASFTGASTPDRAMVLVTTASSGIGAI
jgi:hypothetical protein